MAVLQIVRKDHHLEVNLAQVVVDQAPLEVEDHTVVTDHKVADMVAVVRKEVVQAAVAQVADLVAVVQVVEDHLQVVAHVVR